MWYPMMKEVVVLPAWGRRGTVSTCSVALALFFLYLVSIQQSESVLSNSTLTALTDHCLGSAIKCWVCRSDGDPKCADPFDNRSFPITDCKQEKPRDHLPGLESTMCRKVRQKGTLRVVSFEFTPPLIVSPPSRLHY